MFDFLRSVDLKPIEWTQAIALTRKAAPYIGEVLDAAFSNANAVIVLITPDEIAYLQGAYASGPDDPETQPAPQARPNVLFEAGMALGRHPDRTILVEVGAVRPFSDVAGRHTVRLNNDVASRQELARRLTTAGCAVDISNDSWHRTGDFIAPTGSGLPLGRRIPSSGSRPPVDFDARYEHRGGNRIDKLIVVNRGTETAYEVEITLPEVGALESVGKTTTPKIPGGGRSVVFDVLNRNSHLGGPNGADTFDITITARTDAGEAIKQDVFIDVNG